MELKGEILDIIYKNEVNSYTIAVFETEEETTTIVGYLPFVNSGDTIKAIGEFVEHRDYGLQFKVETFEKILPETPEALEKYLASENIKGVGEATAKRIVKTFGQDTINILRYESNKLTQIRGISEKKAKEISDSFLENWEVWHIVEFLQKFGIGAEHAKKVYDKYGVNAIEEIGANPYILVEITRGVDFKQVDKMALDLGIEYNNEKRIKSGIKYGLICATYNGNCCVIKENLIEFVENLLEVSIEDIENSIIDLKVEEEIIVEEREDEEWLYLQSFYQTEEIVAKRLLQIDNEKNKKKVENINVEIERIEQQSDIYLSEKQKEAIKAINDHNVTIITGGPGTGKTTIIKTIIDLYNKRKDKVVLCAPTGRAAKRMSETTEHEASTLHRLLEIGKIDEDNIYRTRKIGEYAGAPIDADVIVVDEMSMVDIFLMSYLLGCIYKGTKLVLVGDCDQLASVGPGSVLKDIINSKAITTIKLDKIFRQAAKSKIIVNAHKVDEGEGFLTKEEISSEMKDDFFYIKEYSQENALNQVISLCTGRLKNYGDYDFFQNIQVITPTKKGMLRNKRIK